MTKSQVYQQGGSGVGEPTRPRELEPAPWRPYQPVLLLPAVLLLYDHRGGLGPIGEAPLGLGVVEPGPGLGPVFAQLVLLPV